MRTIHADLITAQQSGAAIPYIYLSIGGIDLSDRLVSLEHIEEPYQGRASIVLANSDHYLDEVDLRGSSFAIGYGYVTGSGNKYTGDGAGSDAIPTMWVKSQMFTSLEGETVCILYAEDGWVKLTEYNYITDGSAPYLNTEYTADTSIYDIIDKALQEAGFSLNALGGQDDGIIDTFQPTFVANPLTYDSPASIIRRLISMTKCYLRQVESLAFEVVYPQDADSTNETYYSNQAPYFKEYVEKKNLVIPNSIAVFCNRDPNGEWDTTSYPLITGTATDADSIAQYGTVTEYHIAPYIDNQTDADNRAAAILARYKVEALSGRLLLPFHDCRVELYDLVDVIDTRGY